MNNKNIWTKQLLLIEQTLESQVKRIFLIYFINLKVYFHLLLVTTDIEGELDGAVRTEVGAGAVARVLHVLDDLIGSLESRKLFWI